MLGAMRPPESGLLTEWLKVIPLITLQTMLKTLSADSIIHYYFGGNMFKLGIFSVLERTVKRFVQYYCICTYSILDIRIMTAFTMWLRFFI